MKGRLTDAYGNLKPEVAREVFRDRRVATAPPRPQPTPPPRLATAPPAAFHSFGASSTGRRARRRPWPVRSTGRTQAANAPEADAL